MKKTLTPFLPIASVVAAGLLAGAIVFRGQGFLWLIQQNHMLAEGFLFLFAGIVAVSVRPEVRSRGPFSFAPFWTHRRRSLRKLLYWLTVPIVLRFVVVLLAASWIKLPFSSVFAGGFIATDPVGVPIVSHMVQVNYTLPMIGQWVLESALNDGIGVLAIDLFKHFGTLQLLDIAVLTVVFAIAQAAAQFVGAAVIRRNTNWAARTEFIILTIVDVGFVLLGSFHAASVIGQAAIAAVLQDWMFGPSVTHVTRHEVHAHVHPKDADAHPLLPARSFEDEQRLGHFWERSSSAGMYTILFVTMTMVPIALVNGSVLQKAGIILAAMILARFLGSFPMRLYFRFRNEDKRWGEHYSHEMIALNVAVGTVAMAVPFIGAAETLFLSLEEGHLLPESYLVAMFTILISLIIMVPLSVFGVSRVEAEFKRKGLQGRPVMNGDESPQAEPQQI